MGMLKKAVTGAAKGAVKPGYHKMPDGSVMKDSDMGKSVQTSKPPIVPPVGMPASRTMDGLPTSIPVPKNVGIPQRTTLPPKFRDKPVYANPDNLTPAKPKVRSINPNPIRVPSGGDYQADGSLNKGAIPKMRKPLMERDPMASGVGPIPLGRGDTGTYKIPPSTTEDFKSGTLPRRIPRRPQPYDVGTGNTPKSQLI